jgi:general secretion pathway protein L
VRQGSSQVIVGFLSWWFGQLAELLPAWLRGTALRRPDALVIGATQPLDAGGEIAVWQRRNGKEALLGRFAPGAAHPPELPRSPRLPAVLRLASTDVLQKQLTLPLAAQASLDQVLAFEMDRETPFSADEVYWNHRVEAIDRQRGTILVRLALLPKTHLASLLERLRQIGIAPRWAEVADRDDACPSLPLDGGHGPQHGSRRLLWPAAACCALLALSAVAVPFVRQAVELAKLDSEVAADRPIVAEADALRREIDELSRSAGLVKGELDKAGRPLEVLAAVTRLLPDDTYLTEAELRQRKVTLTGRSAGAARLIGTLAADGRFRNAAFAAPVTRVEALKAEIFTIVAEVGPP